MLYPDSCARSISRKLPPAYQLPSRRQAVSSYVQGPHPLAAKYPYGHACTT